MKPILRSFLILLLFLTPALGATGEAPVRDHEIQAEDYFDLTVLGNLAVSPEGSIAAYTESRWGEGKEGRKTDLWTVGIKDGQSTRMTFDNFGGSHPEWSPDGKYLYFLGRDRAGREDPPHDGSAQVWRMPREGGAPRPVTRAVEGVGTYALAPDGSALYYTVDQEITDDPWSDMRKKYSDLEYGHGIRDLTEVRKLDLISWREQVVLEADRVVWELQVSPDGRRLGLITTTDNELIFKEGWSRVDILDLETGRIVEVTGPEWREDHPSPFGWIEDLTWAADNRAVAFSISYDGYATRLWCAEAPESNDGPWTLGLVDRPEMVSYYGGLKWRGPGRTLCYLGESMGRVRIIETGKVSAAGQGKSRELTEGDLVAQIFAFDPRGKTLCTILETTTDANDVYVVESPTKRKRLTRVNPQVDTWILPQIQHVSWTGADGDECHGILELPPGYTKADGPLPTIIELHGGPTSSSKFRLRLWIYGRTLMAAKGYALLSPNYHGSTGYGDAFLEKLIGRENEIEVTDITLGTQWMIDQGYADHDRIGVMGWSNGGYLTNCMIVAEPDMFAAASSGAGILDMVIQWGTEDTPGHVVNFMEGLPWEQPEHYRSASPLYGLDQVKTPTIIHVGGSDPRVPPAHSRGLYRALQHYLDVPTELVVYPGEPHGLTTHENRLAKIQWDLAWFERYLLGKED